MVIKMDLTKKLAEDLAYELCDKITLNNSFAEIDNILKEMGLNDKQIKFLDMFINEVYNDAYHKGQCDQIDFYEDYIIYD